MVIEGCSSYMHEGMTKECAYKRAAHEIRNSMIQGHDRKVNAIRRSIRYGGAKEWKHWELPLIGMLIT